MLACLVLKTVKWEKLMMRSLVSSEPTLSKAMHKRIKLLLCIAQGQGIPLVVLFWGCGCKYPLGQVKTQIFFKRCLTLPLHLCTALKKPAITKKHDDAPDAVVGAGAGPGVGVVDGPGGQGLSLDQPRLQQDRVEGRVAMIAPLGIVKQAEQAVVFEEDNKAGIKADELGEQQRQLRGTEYTTSL